MKAIVSTGEVVALSPEHDGVETLGAVVPVRAENAVPASGGADLSNVLPFVRANDNAPAPPLELPSDALAAHRAALADGPAHRLGFAALSLVMHGGLAMLLWHDPPPLASIGTEVISVEIVLGATAPAGVAPTPGETETESTSAPDDKPTETEKADEKATEQPQDVQIAEQETAPEVKVEPPPEQPTLADAKPVETVETASAEPSPAETEPAETKPAETAEAPPAETTPVEAPATPTPPEEPKPSVAMVETPQADTPTAKPTEPPPDAAKFSMLPPPQTKPTEKPVAQKKPEAKPKPKATPPKPVKQAAPSDERRRLDAQTRKKSSQEARSAVASSRANNVGIGRSNNDSNYRGMVAAHLMRHKQYPADARSRGDQGTATVTFSLDGSGRVTSARLARGSGVGSIDNEVTAMVRRASPFPAPPAGGSISFTVPVSFRMN